MPDKICDTSDEMATAAALGGKFDKENCGFFEVCDHKVEKYDMTVPGGSVVDIFYCTIDWKKTGPVLMGILALLMYVWFKSKSTGNLNKHKSSKHLKH